MEKSRGVRAYDPLRSRNTRAPDSVPGPPPPPSFQGSGTLTSALRRPPLRWFGSSSGRMRSVRDRGGACYRRTAMEQPQLQPPSGREFLAALERQERCAGGFHCHCTPQADRLGAAAAWVLRRTLPAVSGRLRGPRPRQCPARPCAWSPHQAFPRIQKGRSCSA